MHVMIWSWRRTTRRWQLMCICTITINSNRRTMLFSVWIIALHHKTCKYCGRFHLILIWYFIILPKKNQLKTATIKCGHMRSSIEFKLANDQIFLQYESVWIWFMSGFLCWICNIWQIGISWDFKFSKTFSTIRIAIWVFLWLKTPVPAVLNDWVWISNYFRRHGAFRISINIINMKQSATEKAKYWLFAVSGYNDGKIN